MESTILNQYLPGITAVALYLLSAGLLWRSVTMEQGDAGITQQGTTQKGRQLIGALAVLAALLHALTLYSTAIVAGSLNLSFFSSLSVTAWITVTLLLIMSAGRPVLTLGLIVFPIAALVLALALVFADQQALAVEPYLQWHVLFSVIAYALLTMAAVQSILVALQDKRLHDHRPGGFLRALPSLKLMEQVLSQLLIASFAVLSLALITGFVFLDDLFAQRLVHKTILSLVALLLLAILLVGHYRFGWRGQKAAGMTLGAYIALLLGYFGSKFVKELILSS